MLDQIRQLEAKLDTGKARRFAAALSASDKKELETLSKHKFKHLYLKQLKSLAPKTHKYYAKALSDLKSGKMHFDEASNLFSLNGEEVAEAVYGNDGYNYIKNL